MRDLGHSSFGATISGAILLALSMLVTNGAKAASIDPNASLPGIPQAGYPSFTFNETSSGFSNNIQSWFSNYLVVRNMGNSYMMAAHSEGDFKFWDAEDSYLQGTSGSLDLLATFDLNGNLLSGTLSITGRLPGLGVTGVEDLMLADLIPGGFAYEGNLLGFQIAISECNVAITNCNYTPESIYFSIDGEFPGIPELEDSRLRTTMVTKATVPLPATAWLLLSGLMLIGGRAKLKKA